MIHAGPLISKRLCVCNCACTSGGNQMHTKGQTHCGARTRETFPFPFPLKPSPPFKHTTFHQKALAAEQLACFCFLCSAEPLSHQSLLKGEGGGGEGVGSCTRIRSPSLAAVVPRHGYRTSTIRTVLSEVQEPNSGSCCAQARLPHQHYPIWSFSESARA